MKAPQFPSCAFKILNLFSFLISFFPLNPPPPTLPLPPDFLCWPLCGPCGAQNPGRWFPTRYLSPKKKRIVIFFFFFFFVAAPRWSLSIGSRGEIRGPIGGRFPLHVLATSWRESVSAPASWHLYNDIMKDGDAAKRLDFFFSLLLLRLQRSSSKVPQSALKGEALMDLHLRGNQTVHVSRNPKPHL